jgi:putative transposase
MSYQGINGHTVSRLTVHIVWDIKYRYSVLKGVFAKDHIHMHVGYKPTQSISVLYFIAH